MGIIGKNFWNNREVNGEIPNRILGTILGIIGSGLNSDGFSMFIGLHCLLVGVIVYWQGAIVKFWRPGKKDGSVQQQRHRIMTRVYLCHDTYM